LTNSNTLTTSALLLLTDTSRTSALTVALVLAACSPTTFVVASNLAAKSGVRVRAPDRRGRSPARARHQRDLDHGAADRRRRGVAGFAGAYLSLAGNGHGDRAFATTCLAMAAGAVVAVFAARRATG
jgi:hypothetical protein